LKDAIVEKKLIKNLAKKMKKNKRAKI